MQAAPSAVQHYRHANPAEETKYGGVRARPGAISAMLVLYSEYWHDPTSPTTNSFDKRSGTARVGSWGVIRAADKQVTRCELTPHWVAEQLSDKE
jgi:hypothetical protein